MLDTIVNCTNIYLSMARKSYSRERDASDTDYKEIKALIGILYITGEYHYFWPAIKYRPVCTVI